MVVAKNDAAHQELSRQFHDREVEKEYIALVWGEVQTGKRIDAPIGRDPFDRKKMSARARRSREAVTRIVRTEHLGPLTLAAVAIHTGRTHQIRVHLSAIGHPVVGDLSGIGGEKRPGIVHRLDRGTSGLMVVAKNDIAHEELSRQFHDREVEKEYIALVWGEVQAGRRIDAPIGRDPANRKKMSAKARRSREAVTRIVKTEKFGVVLTLAHIAIYTGRTHQIRVHLSAIGHPIVGDSLYGGVHRRVPGDLRAVTHLTRPFLHAARLVFTHPVEKRRMEFTSPLPDDLQRVLDELTEQIHGDRLYDPRVRG